MSKLFRLKKYNSFGLDVTAREFVEIKSEQELIDLISGGHLINKSILVMGGGSNLLFRNNFDGVILKPVNNQIRILEESSDKIILECDAGLLWDDFVEYCVDKGYGGIENLSHIPGNVGAAPIQNIGAYGTEVRTHIINVHGLLLENGKKIIFSNKDCKFGYRNSVFKQKYKDRILITKVCFVLKKDPYSFNTSYGAVNERVEKLGGLCLKNIREAVISIRKEKLPEPEEIGNAGSFFKNPLITMDCKEKICSKFESVPSYPAGEDLVKIPAGWLVEQCGWKGYRKGDAGVHAKQALVLVNYGEASGDDIFNLSEEIIFSVKKKFDIKLEREVNVI